MPDFVFNGWIMRHCREFRHRPPLSPVPVGGDLAPDTAGSPCHRGEAFGTNGRLAFTAGSKGAVANSSQGGPYLTQQAGLAVHASNRQIPFRGVLNLIHLVRAFLDYDVIPPSQYPKQLGFFCFKVFLYPAESARWHLYVCPLSALAALLHGTVQIRTLRIRRMAPLQYRDHFDRRRRRCKDCT